MRRLVIHQGVVVQVLVLVEKVESIEAAGRTGLSELHVDVIAHPSAAHPKAVAVVGGISALMNMYPANL
jgi:hypothetical protein